MVIFFFLVGLEIKRELVRGQLAGFDRALLPVVAAIGGMAVPALIFWFINKGTPETLSGWAIPSATDIAFAIGVLALLGSRAPISLKILLTAIAVIDDLGAIIVIALFYTQGLSMNALIVAAAALLAMFMLNKGGVQRITPYILLSLLLWMGVMESGIHATIAGVLAALCIPLRTADPGNSPSMRLEKRLHGVVAFAILPLFAFANAGVSLQGVSLHNIFDPITLGIIAGLFVGKQVGIFAILLLMIGLRLSPRPADCTWLQMYGTTVLCGIGFTMSLFIGNLAYQGDLAQTEVRLGVIVGSLLSAFYGYMILRLAPPARKRT
jgi:NhaA family Na+:H+ antiporter